MSAEDSLVHFPEGATLWEIGKLIPYPGNAREHSEAQVAEIAASILELGFNDPIEIDPAGNVLAGHGRLRAARVLNLARVPVEILAHLTPAQAAAYRLANNKLALKATWNDGLLMEELKLVSAGDIDLTLTGFTDEEISDLLGPDEEEPEEAGPAMVIYTITFENEAQRDRWKAHLRWLQKQYPDESMTMAARIVAHVQETGVVDDEEEEEDPDGD